MTDDTDTDTDTDDAPTIQDVNRSRESGYWLSWLWVFLKLLGLLATIATIGYLAHSGVLDASLAFTATVDASTQLSVLLWIVVATIGLVSLQAIMRLGGPGFVNSVFRAIHKLRFED